MTIRHRNEEAAFMGMVEYLSGRLKGLVLDYQKLYESASREKVMQYIREDMVSMAKCSPEWWSERSFHVESL